MVTTIVVDSSVITKWLSQDNEKYIDKADKILSDTQRGKIVLITPELAKYEIGNVLLFSKHLLPDQANVILSKLHNLPLSFITESEQLARDTFSLAHNLGISYYDASFLSVTKQYNATLVTDNVKHQGKDPVIKVISLKDY